MSDNSFWGKALRGENLIKKLASEIELFWFTTGEYSRKDGSRLVWLADISDREEVKKSLAVLLKNKPSAELLAKHFADRCEELDDDTREYERAHKLALDLMAYCRGV